MCLILFALGVSARYPFVLAGNRDEYHQRPTAAADYWPPHHAVLGGRDLAAGGSWLALSRDGRLGAVTNHRDGRGRQGARSRGHLVSTFVEHQQDATEYLQTLMPQASSYGGFNLLLWDREALHYASNRGAPTHAVTPGVHGLSNAVLDSPWPKVSLGKDRLARILENDPEDPTAALFDMMSDRNQVPDHLLPETGVALEWERLLSPAFIQTPDYGTRATTVVLVDASGHLQFAERSYDPAGNIQRERRFRMESFRAAF